jgi:histidinol-phosphate aminotransferase
LTTALPAALKARLNPVLASLKAYQPESAPARILLDANENPFDAPAGFRSRAASLARRLAYHRYPDPAAADLRRVAARAYGVRPENLVFGNGSDELIQLLVLAFAGEGGSCLVPQPTFSMYRACALAGGLKVWEEPLGADFGLTPGFFKRAAAGPSLIFLAWPNSPTGTLYPGAQVEKLLALKGTVLVLDEAYAEFSGDSFLARLDRHPNLVILRTLSKAWGLAGLRLGLLACHPDLAAELEKLRLPYNVDGMAQALALEALKKPAALEKRRKEILAERTRLEAGFARLPGLKLYPGAANFLFVRHPKALEFHGYLLKRGIRVRSFGGGISDCLRITVGKRHENALLLKAAHSFFKERA